MIEKINIVRNKNRQLYCSTEKRYVNYEDLHRMISEGKEIRVFEGKSKKGTTKDITNYILRQIIRYSETLQTDGIMRFLQKNGPLQ